MHGSVFSLIGWPPGRFFWKLWWRKFKIGRVGQLESY
jgi:hypothetical protein